MLDARFRGRYVFAPEPEWGVASGAAIVENNPGNFELAEFIRLAACDPHGYIDLFPPGERPGARGTLSLQLVDGSREARILPYRHVDGTDEPLRELHMTIPAQGFLDEEIRLDYELTRDQTFRMQGHSRALGNGNDRNCIIKESEDLRFAYESLEGRNAAEQR